jgi:hypothetical protein
MNIIKYKNIDELIKQKDTYLAQEIDSDQLKLITKGYIPTKFNIGVNDVLEFVLYDNSNNVLPQETYGNVRYIKGDNIKDYLLVSNNPNDTLTEGGGFVVDIKKLIKEAGYNTGLFRVQINFQNNRVGSDYVNDKLWVQEISPSRLEVRLLPFNNFNENSNLERDIKNDLNLSYDTFIQGKFSGDEVYQEIYNILDLIKASDIANIMTTILTQPTINKLAQEFNIVGGYDLFYAKVLEDAKRAVVNELLYRNSEIGSSNFGKLYSDINRREISTIDYKYYNKEEIIQLISSKFKESINYHLPKRTLIDFVRVDSETKASLDALNDVVQKLESSEEFQLPQINREIIEIPPTIETTEEQGTFLGETEILPASSPIPPPQPTPTPNLTLTFVSGPSIQNITANEAEITWESNIVATAIISFFNAVCPEQGCEITIPGTSLINIYKISGLKSLTEYSFKLKLIGLKQTISLESQQISFKTAYSADSQPVYIDPGTTISGGGGTYLPNYVDLDGRIDTADGSIRDFTNDIK